MLSLAFHGVAGGLDELVIAVVAIGVLWLAVKLAGKKPASEEDENAATEVEEEQQPGSAAPTR